MRFARTVSIVNAHAEGEVGNVATVIGNGRLDRSPTGTGVAARRALFHHERSISLGLSVTFHSLFGTEFEGRIVESEALSDRDAVIPEVWGQAWITGFSQALVDPSDPLAQGHCPKDVWLSEGQRMIERGRGGE